MARSNSDNGMNTPGFKTPLNVGPIAGDAYDAPLPPAPTGRVPDPIGNIASVGGPKAPKMLPEK